MPAPVCHSERSEESNPWGISSSVKDGLLHLPTAGRLPLSMTSGAFALQVSLEEPRSAGPLFDPVQPTGFRP